MVRPKYRIYVDTSVVGGCLEQGFAEDSKRVIKLAEDGYLTLVISRWVIEEVNRAPKPIRQLFAEIRKEALETLGENSAALELSQAYIDAKIVTKRSRTDAIHVAHATVARVDAIVSWNFKDIVRLDKIKAYNQINILNGYGFIQILSPKEVNVDEKT